MKCFVLDASDTDMSNVVADLSTAHKDTEKLLCVSMYVACILSDLILTTHL